MAQIKVVPSMAFDAICYLEKRFLNNKGWLLPEQIEFIEKINGLCGDKLGDDCFVMSTLCLILTIYAEDADFENYSLDDLAELFKDPEDIRNVVKPKITNGFGASYVYPSLDYLVDGLAEKYVKMINVLKEIGFDKYWESDLLPTITDEIKTREDKYKDVNIGAILTDIQKLKQCELSGDVKIYVSFMSYPTSFALYETSFLQCICIRSTIGDVGLICHELMHGFATMELTNLYLEYVKSIKYLTEQHDRLINDQHSGNEEEFVMAAEYYLRMKHNNENINELLKVALHRYGGCVPTSVFLFNLLSQETETPNGYAQWLTDVFKNNKLPKKAIERNLDEIVPVTDFEKFIDKQFGCFKRMLLKIQKVQKNPINSFNAEKKIEKIVNRQFEEINEKNVYFGQERQPLPNALTVKEIEFDNLFINVAEYEDIDKAIGEWIDDTGANMWASDWHKTNFSFIGRTSATSSITFVINNFRISLTAKCPDYVTRGIDYPSNLKEHRDYIISFTNRIHEEGITKEQIDKEHNITPYEELCVKYSDEILSSQKKIEDIVMKLLKT